MDNVTASVRRAGGRSWTDSYTYNADKQPLTAAVSSSRKIEYTYDSLGRLTGKNYTLDSPLKNNYIYPLSNRNAQGADLYRTTQLRYEFLGNTAYRYSYDAVGNITKIEEGVRAGEENAATGLTEKITYEYDALGQLTRENNRYLNATVVYAYDGGGNLTSRTIYPYTTGELGEATDTITYTYDSQWKDLLTGYDGQSITSDEIGNPLTYRDGMSMSWDGRQLTQLTKDGTTITYQYGSDGLRTSKTVNGEEHRYWYQDGQLVYEERGDSKQFYYSYDGYGHLSCIRYYHNGTGYVYYVQTNSRGDVEALYLGDGSLRVRYLYDSWGNTISIQNGNGQELTGPNDIGNLNPFRYRGYYLDSETGLYYLHNRYYDPQTCRFVNGDEYVSTGQGFTGNNMFAYCLNSPVQFMDQTGTLVALATPGGCYNPGTNNWFNNAWNSVKKWANDTFGAGHSTTATIAKREVEYLPDPFPITAKTGTKTTHTLSECGNSSKPISVYAEFDANHFIDSSAGIRFNISDFTLDIGFGLSDTGVSSSFTNGNTTNSFGIKANLAECKAGFESSSSVKWDNTTETTYSNVSISGWAVAAAYVFIASGQLLPTPIYG